MRSNFHYQPSDKISPAAASLMQQLRRTEQQIQQKRRLFQQKQIQEQNLRQQEYNPRDNRQNQRLKQEFYQLTPKGNNQIGNDFFSKFSNNNDDQMKKEMYRNQLNKQIQSKRQESVEKQRRQQLADDVWSNVLKGRGNVQKMIENRSSSPAYRVEQSKNQSRVTNQIVNVSDSRNTRIEEPVIYSKPAKIAEVHITDEELRQQKIKEEKKRLYYQELNRQIQEGKRRKQEDKRMQKQKKIETFEAKFTSYSKSQQKNNKNQEGNQDQQSKTVSANQGDRQQEQRVLKKRYTKGLIDIEEYQRSVRLLNLRYGKKQEQEKKKPEKVQILQPKIDTQLEHRQNLPLPSRKIQSQYANRDANQSFHNNNMGTSRHMYSQSLIQQPTQYYPAYPTSRPEPIYQSTPPNLYPNQLPPLQQTNHSQSPNLDPYQYANIIQQNQMELLQKMMEGMKDIIATTLMYDKKKEDIQKYESRERDRDRQYLNLNTIETEQYKSVQRQIPLRQLRSPQLTKIHSPSPRNFMQPSLSLQNIKIAYESIDQSKNFFKKPPKLKGFKKFDYVEKMGGSTVEIPNTSCFVTSGDGFQKLQKSFEKDIIQLKQSQLNQQIENIKDEKPYFKKKPQQQPIQMETATFKLLGIQKKQYDPSSHQSIQEQSEQDYNVYNPQPIKPKKWRDNDSSKFIKQSKKQIEYVQKQSKQISPEKPKQNNLQQQFSQGIFGFSTFVVDDIAQLRKQLRKQQTEQSNPAILERSTYQVPKPIIIVNEPQQQPATFKNIPKPKQIYELEEIEVQSKSELEQFLRPPHPNTSSRKNLRRQSSSIRGAQDSIDAQSNFQESVPHIKTNVMKLSRNKLSEMKKSKDGILLDFMALSSPSKKQYNLPYNPYTYEQEITEKIEEPSVYQNRRISNRSNSKQKELQQEYQESQTLLSKYEESNLKQQSELNYSRQPSSLTSLQEARNRAKQGRNREKKESSLITISTLQQLEREIKKKQPQEQSVMKKLKPTPTLLKNPKQLLGMLDDMVDVDEQEQYPHEFDSYRQDY